MLIYSGVNFLILHSVLNYMVAFTPGSFNFVFINLCMFLCDLACEILTFNDPVLLLTKCLLFFFFYCYMLCVLNNCRFCELYNKFYL